MIVTPTGMFHIKIFIPTPRFKTRAQTGGHVRGDNTFPCNNGII